MSLFVSIRTKDHRTRDFIVSSMDQSQWNIRLWFDNGHMSIDKDTIDTMQVFDHGNSDTDIYNPTLILSARGKTDQQIEIEEFMEQLD